MNKIILAQIVGSSFVFTSFVVTSFGRPRFNGTIVVAFFAAFLGMGGLSGCQTSKPIDAGVTPIQEGVQQGKPRISDSKLVSLAPMLAELGEQKTLLWLAALRAQCSERPKANAQACEFLTSLGGPSTWPELQQRMTDQWLLKCQGPGLLSGYYEPILKGSLLRTNEQQVPLLPFPSHAEKAAKAGQAWLSRRDIEAEIANGNVSSTIVAPLLWVDDPVEAFFLHIQGSGRISLSDQTGGIVRVTFAGHNGWAYRAIGTTLIEEAVFTKETLSAEGIKSWLREKLRGGEQDRLKAIALMQSNPRYIFFKQVNDLASSRDAKLGPRGAMNTPLTAMASVAADPQFHALGSNLLIWSTKFGAQLAQVQDVGGGIKGFARLDLFTGTGEQAGHLASNLKEPILLFDLVPRTSRQETLTQLDVATSLANCSAGM